MFSHKYAAFISWGTGLVLLVACDKESDGLDALRQRAATEPASVTSVARHLGVDAADLVMPTDPAPPAGDFKADLARFVSLDACVAEHTALDPLVGDALDAIGYDTFLRDACHVLEAAKRSSLEPCLRIDASAMRERCAETLALVEATPDHCPLRVAGKPALGRGPSCVAIAARDAALCAAEERGKRPACEALAAVDAKRCRGDDAQAARCRRAVARFRGVLGSPQPAKELPKARGVLKITPQAGAPPLDQREMDLAPLLAQGVVLVEGFGGGSVDVGAVRETTALAHVAMPARTVRVAATVSVGTALGGLPRVDHFELEVPGGAPLVCPGMQCSLRAASASIERNRGGAFSVTIDGTVANGPRAYAVHVEAATFVRDVVSTTPIDAKGNAASAAKN